jgi:hypothetical protein
MDNHVSEACRQRKHAETITITSHSNTSRKNESSGYHCGLQEHFKSNCIHFNNAQDQRNRVNKGPAPASLTTAENHDLI